MPTRTLLLLTSILLIPVLAGGQEPTAHYIIELDEAASHRMHIEARIPAEGVDSVTLWMAVWTPGSYKIRDYSKNIEELKASDSAGRSLPVEKLTKNRWQITCADSDEVVVQYRAYGRTQSVRNCFIDSDGAMLNGAATFLIPEGGEEGPFDVRIVLPDGWTRCETSLPLHPDGASSHYLATDIDNLFDNPIVAGDLHVESFEVDEIPHWLVFQGDRSLWDCKKAAEDVHRIVEEQIRFWGIIPYRGYRFLNVIAESGGGLEHLDSTLMLTSRWSYRDKKRYRGWLGLVSHEFFHTWNVKRLRPRALGPFDYHQEVYTDDLWVVEGITSYYDDLLLARAGLLNRKQYLENLSKQIGSLQKTPGRLVHPLATTSRDAWIKHYHPDENSVNSTISYYTKGAVIGFLLDAKIRETSGGTHNLDEVMRLAYHRYSGDRGYESVEFRSTASEVAGTDLSDWFRFHVDEAKELDYSAALAWLGLRFKDPNANKEDDEKKAEDKEPKEGWMGLETSDRGGRVVISSVRLGTPAFASGLNVDDEILAIAGYRLLPGQWKSRRKQHPPGSTVTVMVSRRGAVREIEITLLEEPEENWKLEVNPKASEEQKVRLAAWLGRAGQEALEEEEKRKEKKNTAEKKVKTGG